MIYYRGLARCVASPLRRVGRDNTLVCGSLRGFSGTLCSVAVRTHIYI